MLRLICAPILAFALAPMLCAQCQCNPVGSPPYGGCYTWNYSSCSWQATSCGSSPIVIDISGNGFHLTSASDGVMFDFFGTGHPIKIAWTASGARNAWLVLDRNGNGVIDSGKEMFGNLTDQPPSPDRNGFLALAEFDKRENGGNSDGIIDSRDSVFSRLRLWVDRNHNGISEPEELFPLPALGVHSIDLKYRESKRQDQFGDIFRYRGILNGTGPRSEAIINKWAYDVFLMVEASGAISVFRNIDGQPGLFADLQP